MRSTARVGGTAHKRAVEYAQRAGKQRIALGSVAFRMMLQAWGCTPAREGLAEVDALLREYERTSIEPHLRYARALHLSYLGEDEAARREQALSQDLFRQFGNELHLSSARMSSANTEIRAGNFEVAEAEARRGVEGLERLGETGFLSSTLGQLADALYGQGRWDEAEAVAQRTLELATAEDFDPHYHARAVLAKVRARRGEFAEAERLAREAVAIVEPTDWHHQRGDAFASLGEVLELAGRQADARTAYEQALTCFERKQALPEAQAMRARLALL